MIITKVQHKVKGFPVEVQKLKCNHRRTHYLLSLCQKCLVLLFLWISMLVY